MLLRAHSSTRPRWRLGLVAAVAATLPVSLFSTSQGAAAVPAPAAVSAAGSPHVARAAEPPGFAVQLGPEQRLIGPTGEGDNPYFSERRGGKLYGYFGTSRTREWRANNNTRLTHSRIVLDRGAAGRFDDCGAWMVGSFMKNIDPANPGHWIAFYHAEGSPASGDGRCDHYANTTVWRMGMAETINGGKTWQRAAAPVLTGKGADANHGTANAGNGRAIRISDGPGGMTDYYYILFETSHGTDPGVGGLHMARAKIDGDGMPKAWRKYYCHPATALKPAYCDWDEPGIGGKSTPIGGISEKARHVVWNSALNRWLGFDASGKRGFRLYASQVGVGETTVARQHDALFFNSGNPRSWVSYSEIYPLVSRRDRQVRRPVGRQHPRPPVEAALRLPVDRRRAGPEQRQRPHVLRLLREAVPRPEVHRPLPVPPDRSRSSRTAARSTAWS